MRSMFTSEPFGTRYLGQAPQVTVQPHMVGGFWGGSFFAAPAGGPTLKTPPPAWDGGTPYEGESPEERRRRSMTGRLGQPEISLTADVANDYAARVQKGLALFDSAGKFLKDHPDEKALADSYAKLTKAADPLASGVDWAGLQDALKRRSSLTQRQMDAINALDTAAKDTEPLYDDAVKRSAGGTPAWGILLLIAAFTFGALEATGTTNVLGLRGR